MAQLGTTRYGLGLTFNDTASAKASTKTANGFNFSTGGASAIANEAAQFVWGTTGANNGLSALVGDGYELTNADVISRNQILGGNN